MEMLSEYFKFHRDVPRVIERSIEKILRKHQDKQREHDYKKIKRILKEEQGVSITSLEKTITNEEPSISKNQLTDLGSILKGLQDEN